MAQAPGGNIRFWLKGYLFLGVAVLILAMQLYSNHLIARMQVNADIHLGARSVFEYLFSPVQKIAHEAGRER